jgi:fructokinase
MRVGAVEAGGTKFMCAVGSEAGRPEEIQRFDTAAHPLETMAEVIDYFRKHGPVSAVGVASFGPIDYASGRITRTPKIPWQDFPIRGALESALQVRVGLETDVNAAALGEYACGAARGCEDFVYITVGTGIGGGAMSGGRLVHGRMHPEMGHLLVRRHSRESAAFEGVCPFHKDCLEGMASGPAMRARTGQAAELLAEDDPAWGMEAWYLAQACVDLACVLSPRRILLGGGVMAQAHLLAKVEAEAEKLVAGYLEVPEIVAPELPYPGLSGALTLALER